MYSCINPIPYFKHLYCALLVFNSFILFKYGKKSSIDNAESKNLFCLFSEHIKTTISDANLLQCFLDDVHIIHPLLLFAADPRPISSK